MLGWYFEWKFALFGGLFYVSYFSHFGAFCFTMNDTLERENRIYIKILLWLSHKTYNFDVCYKHIKGFCVFFFPT